MSTYFLTRLLKLLPYDFPVDKLVDDAIALYVVDAVSHVLALGFTV